MRSARRTLCPLLTCKRDVRACCRYNHDNRPNPYNRGILNNCAEIWCTPIPPSEVRGRTGCLCLPPGGWQL